MGAGGKNVLNFFSYYAPLDENGRRTDFYERPELCNGAVEFIATGDYMVRAPQPPVYMFLIDVSATAISSGFTQEVCEGIRATIRSGRVVLCRRCRGVFPVGSSYHGWK